MDATTEMLTGPEPASPELGLYLLQQPDRARVSKCIKERDRRPVDPPPVIQLHTLRKEDRERYLQSPYLFVCASLYHPEQDRPYNLRHPYDMLGGTLVSSLHRLKDSTHADGGFFVFSDVTLKIDGLFRLRFSLFEMAAGVGTEGMAGNSKRVRHIASTVSRQFTAYPPKQFPGMLESTALSRSFAEQGVRLRIRKSKRQTLPSPSPSHSPHYDRQRQAMAYPEQQHHQLQFRVDAEQPEQPHQQEQHPPPQHPPQLPHHHPQQTTVSPFALPSLRSLPPSGRSLPPLSGWPYPQRPPAEAPAYSVYAGPRLPPILPPPRSQSPRTHQHDV